MHGAAFRMGDVTVLSIEELIKRGLPLTGKSNHPDSPPCNPIPVEIQSNPKYAPSTTSSSAESNRSSKVLTSLNYPAIIIGVLKLPTGALGSSNSKSSSRCANNNCLQFSDGSATICCDIVDIDIRLIGKEIRVVSWNFIPLRSGGGFLEIIKWEFLYPSSGLHRSANIDPILLDTSICSTSDDKLKAPYCVRGALESVGSITIVPCTEGQRNSQSNKHSNSSTDLKNLRGFVANLMVCECSLCTSGESDSVREHDTHSFVKPKIVYLCGSASSWHPVVTKFVGRFITFCGLKKKLVSFGKAKSCLMYVSTEKSSLHLSMLSRIQHPCKKRAIKGKGECNSYTGIVKGVYMQGMLLELDNEVWLLLTDQLLSPPHSLRVGAIVSVRNVHFVNPRFRWGKLLILGACVKTSIFVQLFSPLETECHVISQSRSMLGKLIETLQFSARLWVLILIASFRKMFAGVLSEKEILGSKHKEGLVQLYAKLHLPSSVYRYQHGAVMKLYQHDSCGCGIEPCNINLDSVVPIFILIFYCNVTWRRTIGLNNETITCKYNQPDLSRLLSCKGRAFCQPVRKVFQSEDIRFVLVGSLKISTHSGRLQLVDVTGGIDVLVPDLPSTWNANNIYEVTKYTLVIEGITQMETYFAKESFSCRNFFHRITLERDPKIAVYVYFHYRNATCKNLPLYSHIEHEYDSEISKSGTYHLLQVTHKFPLLPKFQDKQLVANTSSMFVEAVIYSWTLFLSGSDEMHSIKQAIKDSKASKHQHVDKRLKLDHSSGRVDDADLICDLGDSSCGFNVCSHRYKGFTGEQKCCNYHGISCLATVRSPKHVGYSMVGFLFNTRSKSSSGGDPRSSAQKVLLEFGLESSLKYQFLQIGNYYITKHHGEDSLCNIKEPNCVKGHKFLITSSTLLWSISFMFDDDLLHSISSNPTQFDDSSSSDSGMLSGDQINLRHGTFSDICLHLPANSKSILVLDSEGQEEEFTKPILRPEETGNKSPCCRNVTSSTMQVSLFRGSDFLFPEGNLSSLQGHVVAVHDVGHCCVDFDLKRQHKKDDSLCGSFLGVKRSCCIHILVDDQIVKIFGSLKNYTLPVGFGPGINATFHRVLELGDQQKLMLTPLSFIVINYFRVYNYLCTKNYSESLPFLDSASLQLFSELNRSTLCKSTKFRCRVAAVCILVLEKNTDHVNLQFEEPRRQPLVNIPLAGFILDDGSSKCHCWTSGDKAVTLLRLHDPLPPLAFENIDWTSNWTGMPHNSYATLGRILKNHGRIIVRSCGSMLDSYQDVDISFSSQDALSSADEKLIKLTLFNACCSSIWTVIGSQLDSNAVQSLLKGHMMEQELMQSHNIWASDVFCTSTLTEARNAIQELINRSGK